MTAYINWMAYKQESKDGTFQTQGNTVADYDAVASASSATAPEGAQYATISCDVATKLNATRLKLGDVFQDKDLYCAAGERIEIPNVVPKVTVITVTDV